MLCEITSLEEREGLVVGWLPGVALLGSVPLDAETSRWESARISVRADDIVAGLPGPTG